MNLVAVLRLDKHLISMFMLFAQTKQNGNGNGIVISKWFSKDWHRIFGISVAAKLECVELCMKHSFAIAIA